MPTTAIHHPLPLLGRFLQQVGPTPLVPVQLGDGAPIIWCKLEFLNPSGSTKDRIARYMLEKAWRTGQLREGGTVVEASSGSTSIALALTCAQMGLRFVAVMPDGVSRERLLTIAAYGGRTQRVSRELGIRGAIAAAERLAREEGALHTRQFENPDNPEAHRLWTGQEILSQIPRGMVHAVVSGVGTGGTIVGLYSAFSQAGCAAIPVAARPVRRGEGSTHTDLECCSFSTRVPGVVEGISKLYTHAALPGLREIDVDEDDALQTTKLLIQKGFPVGPSSGLNYCAAATIARELGPDAQVVTVFADRMERYFSTELFAALGDGGESLSPCGKGST